MNSLEFIDKEIEKIEQCLMINKTHSVLNYKLKYFQQIKSELEAWEVCKKHLILDKTFHQIDFIDIHLHHDTKYKEDYIKLKKALEVEENVD